MQKYRINQQIRSPKVRLIGGDGEQIGVISTKEAVEKARTQGLDLVEVSPKAEPPVCKIMDYGHWIYTQSKLEQKNKSKSRRSETKGIRLSYNMGKHDLEVRVKQAQKFLKSGDRVKAEVILKGRQKAHPEKVEEVLLNFQEMLGNDIKVEQQPKREGFKYTALYAPDK